MPEKINFSEIADRYENTSVIQKSASELLFELLDIKEDEDVLDAGCGSGGLTAKIRRLTKGKITGIDPSSGMIETAKKEYGYDIDFIAESADNLSFEDKYNVIFCNSAFQWFKKPEEPLKRFYRALKTGGRIGIQAPATKMFCPNFIRAIDAVKSDSRTGDIFKQHNDPWFYLESSEEYKNLFEKYGFKVPYAEIKQFQTKHSPDEIYQIFSSGAIAGYLNQEYYGVRINQEYIDAFKSVVKEDFIRQAESPGIVKLIFNRIYLLAVKK